MTKVLVTESNLTAIANAIRGRNGSSNTYKPGQMADAVTAIPNSYAAGDEGKVVYNGALVAQTARSSSITENGTYDTTNNNSILVNVSGSGDSRIPYYERKTGYDGYIDTQGNLDRYGYTPNITAMYWEVTPNTRYLLYLSSDVGNNIRVASYDADLSDYESSERYPGQLLVNATPTSFAAYSIVPTNSYLIAMTRTANDFYAFLIPENTTL